MRAIRAFLILSAIAGAFTFALVSQNSQAQPPGTDSFSICTITGTPPASGSCTPVSAANPLPVDASVSASISGFTAASTGTPFTPFTADTNAETGTLPAGEVVVAFNTSTSITAYCKLGASATVGDVAIPPSSWFAYTVGVSTQLTCITASSTAVINMVGGAGLPTGAGGGGGGGAVTVADGADVAQGAVADAACATDNGTCSLIALTKRTNQNLTSGLVPTGTYAAPSSTLLSTTSAASVAQLSTAALSFSSSGNNTLVTRSVGTIKVYGIAISCASAVATFIVQNGTATAVGTFPNTSSIVLGMAASGQRGEPLWTTTSTNNFVANLSSGIVCGGTIWYLDN